MKMTSFYPGFLCLICTLAFNNTQAQSPYSDAGMPMASVNTHNQHGEKAGVDHVWYEQAVQNIEESERQIFKNNTPGHYHTVNTKKREGFIISPNAFSVYPLNVSGADSLWNIRLSIASIEKGKTILKPEGKYEIQHEDNWIRYLFRDFDVEYINGDGGLRQNFIVKEKPAGTASLKVRIKLSGSLAARITATNAVQFFDKQDGVNRLMYDDLKVWDANHQPVAANMSLENDGTSLVIEAADQQAVYPLTIDPITYTPEWTTSANGLLSSLSSVDINSALYGYAVTSVGDVNGDGFGDVAISAPTVANIFAGNGSLANVGAVFVFYGTSNGLATTPAKILQPNTAVAGALFGLSVDAGDVTGDGINDIVIGAPLDKTSVTIGVLNFSGTVGKVYVFPGGSSAAINPTNFLTVQLNTAYEGLTNLSVNALFGFSVSATEDMNGDGKKDILVGSPLYASIASPGVQTGGAFLFLSNASNTFSTVQSLQPPAFNLLGINLPLLSGINGLLFGYSVDGLGDYNGDGINDLVVGAPAGVNLSSLTGILNGQVLGGSAYVYYGATGNAGSNTTTGAQLQAASSGLLGNAANLFGFKVKGLRTIKGARNGGLAVGAPVGGLIPAALSLSIQSGSVSIFKSQSTSPSGVVLPNQTIETPRSSNILQVLNTMNTNDLFGASIDNGYDVNCDGFADLVVGSPISSGTNLSQLQVNGVGGSVYVYYGNGVGSFQNVPASTVSASYGADFLSINAVAMFGFSVTAGNNMYGPGTSPRIIAGAPSAALDFNGLLNLGNTIGTLFSFAATNNGPGKVNIFSLGSCSRLLLPVSLTTFTGKPLEKSVLLEWTSVNEADLNQYEVERNSNNAGFTTIGMVFPNETGSTSTYPFKDASPAIGYSQYRLKMIDKDGKYKYSNIIVVQFTLQTNSSLKIFPNPVGSTLNLSLTGIVNGNYSFKVIDALGQVLLEQSVIVSQQNQIMNLTRPTSMRPGMYWISLLDAKGQQIQKTQFIAQ